MNVKIFLAQAADPAFLVSWWKVLLIYLPFIPWGWIAATKVDKDARFFHLNPTMWNGINLGAGVAALAAMLFIPIFWAGWPVGIFILAAPLMTYLKVRNENVPEDKQYHLTGASLAELLESRRVKKATRAAVLHFTDHEDKSRPAPMKDEPHYDTHMFVEDLITPALDGRAARLDLTITPKGCAVGQLVDGIRYKREPLSSADGLQVFDFIKDIAGLNVEERRKRQSGKCVIAVADEKTNLTVTTAGSSAGHTMRIDFNLASQINKPLDTLGLLPSQFEELTPSLEPHERHGFILLAAPRGHGLTTTCYYMLGSHDAYIANIKSLEREIQLLLDGPDQVQYDPSNPDIDYATNLQSILRRDPDVVLTDEIQDVDTAQIIAESGMEGPLLYIPQVQPTIVDQIRIWVKLVGDVKLATKSIRHVINQRLMRTLCPSCRQAYKPTPEQLKKLNLPASKVSELFKAGGKIEIKGKIEDCPICQGIGYMGQTAAFEILTVDSEIRKIIGTGDLKAALAHARRNKMIYLQEAALTKVINGETSIEEVIRVTSPAKEGKKGQGPSAAA